MMSEAPASELTFDGPARYRIRVRGRISVHWADLLSGLSLLPLEREGQSIVSVLEGELLDQAALAGVLGELYEMRLPLLSVQCLNVRPA